MKKTLQIEKNYQRDFSKCKLLIREEKHNFNKHKLLLTRSKPILKTRLSLKIKTRKSEISMIGSNQLTTKLQNRRLK